MTAVRQAFAAQVDDLQRVVIYSGHALNQANVDGTVMIAIASEFGDAISVWDKTDQHLATVPVNSSVVLACNRNQVIALGGPTAGANGRMTRGGYLKGQYEVSWDGAQTV